MSYLSKSNASTVVVTDHFRSAWNHLRFGWYISLPPNLTPGIPIHFLGRRYLELKGELENIRCGPLDGDVEAFMQDFSSRIWFTYRDNFEPIITLPNNDPHKLPSLSSNNEKIDDGYLVTDSMLINSVIKSTADFRQSIFSCGPFSKCSPIPRSFTNFNCSSKCLNSSSSSDNTHVNYPPHSFQSSTFHLKVPTSVRTSDCGWGCMVRSGQMLLAQALVMHFLGRDWIYAPEHKNSSMYDLKDRLHRRIIRWFGDSPSSSSPLSIHKLVQASGNPPGTWFGPSSICRALIVTMATAEKSDSLLGQFEIYMARDRVICVDEVLDLFSNCPQVSDAEYCTTDHTANHRPSNQYTEGVFKDIDLLNGDLSSGLPSQRNRGLLLLVPMRLGGEKKINPVYASTLLRLLKDPACVGLIGGRPRSSVYMAGCQENRLIYFDPHFCQENVDVNHKYFRTNSWHCFTPRLMSVQSLDPSCAFGFYCSNRVEVEQLLLRLPRLSELRTLTGRKQVRTALIEVMRVTDAKRLFSSPNENQTVSQTIAKPQVVYKLPIDPPFGVKSSDTIR